jgi:hypothetical protein
MSTMEIVRDRNVFYYHEPLALEPSIWDLWLQKQKERLHLGALEKHKKLLEKKLKTIPVL